ncbi:tRNA (adenosine(37)-N6)-threonylcarbamoyltransferase complex transferase subunit TsaD [Candidatus Giovannonibacteria bacterium RIFCSPHIGHO2_01_FULL_45_33]|nr:MAG: tRNA (adenosine(37)-N6)-threonylcarbamoyltransferase complex transferase subunit TsaD [Candidatus Giovannonibacteria bacterium RIFCSPHIGHO2_01_FULL_45_33]
MRILAIETSCDETAIAVLKIKNTRTGENFSILSAQVSSQVSIHRPFGGVVPNLAKREHIKNLPILFKKVLKEITAVDAIAITSGPGLEPALWTGINFAQELVKKYNLPLVPVNHLEGHIYSAFMHGDKFLIPKNIFPLLTLIVSGGHTELVLTKKHLEHKILGETLDDAAGEAFDKVARMLELPYPGGPEISKLAKKFHNPLNPPYLKGDKYEKLFPRPMINSKDLNFSFSGLKTSVLYYLRDNPKTDKALVAYEFEQAVVDVLVSKTLKAIEKYNPKTVALGGGVAANDKLREELSRKLGAIGHTLLLPEKQFTGDNAAMIAVAAYFKAKAKKFSKPSASRLTIKAEGGLKLTEK